MLDPQRTNINLRKKPVCPICAKPKVAQYAPFCSRRCQQIDLNRWLGETYRIETDEAPEGHSGGAPDDLSNHSPAKMERE